MPFGKKEKTMEKEALYNKYDSIMTDTCYDIGLLVKRNNAQKISVKGVNPFNKEHLYAMRCAQIMAEAQNWPLYVENKIQAFLLEKYAHIKVDGIDRIGAGAIDVDVIVDNTKYFLKNECFTIEDIYNAFIGSKEVFVK